MRLHRPRPARRADPQRPTPIVPTHSRTAATSSASLDFVKAPLFDWTLGRALPPSGHANADDLQDLLILYLEQCKAGGGELYAFGAKFDRNLHKPIDAEFGNTDGLHGIHDIHLNQANVGAHAEDNGTLTTGDYCCRSPIESWVYSWPSRPSASRPIPPAQWPLARNHYPGSSRAVLARRWRPRRCTWSALINPAGSDPGHEAVVIGNCATTSQSLHGWQLIDRNGRVTKLDAEIPGGASTIVVLDGTGVQLGKQRRQPSPAGRARAPSRQRHLLRERRRRGGPLHPLPAMTEGIDGACPGLSPMSRR